MTDCPFCGIVNRSAPAEIVYESASALAFFPTEPATMGHTLVIPKRHFENFLDLPASEVPGLWLAVRQVGLALGSVLGPDGMNLISSAGEAASQTIMHLHVHVVPRWKGDAIGDIWPPKHPANERVLDDVAKAIRDFSGSESLEYRNPEEDQSKEQDQAVEHPN